MLYKVVPHIYHRVASEDDLYALFRLGAALVRRDVSSTVQPATRLAPQARRQRGARKARLARVEVCESTDFAGFWPLLRATLAGRHGVEPVHAVNEIVLLARRFPGSIRLFTATEDAEIVAGTVIYETPQVAHAQYIACSPRGRVLTALDLLFEELIVNVFRDKPYFDFGISTESEGTALNVGLIEFKEGFGATATVHDFYEVDLRPRLGRTRGS